MNNNFVRLPNLRVDIPYLLELACKLFEDSNKWYYAEPKDVIDTIGVNNVFKDVNIENNKYVEELLSKINIKRENLFGVFYQLPAISGFSPIHVDYETCNIIIPLHDTANKAFATWYEWPKLKRAITDLDWELYNEDWNANPICKFSSDMQIIESYYWQLGESILFNTRQPHSSTNFHNVDRINFIINIYNTPFEEVSKMYYDNILFNI